MFHNRLDMRFFLSACFVIFSQLAVAQTDVPGCTIEIACNYDPAATLNDGSCDFISCLVLGCTDVAACNYDETATVNDGSCDYLSCLLQGCTLSNACNFDPAAEVNDGSCEYTSCAGCTNEFADNYDATATVDDGSCNPIEGCLSPQACNFNPNANQDDGSCDFLSCLATGCTDLEACNYDAEAQVNDGTCNYPEEGRDCDGNCLEDADGDDVCDGDEIPGCTSPTALNYNPIATDDNGTCQEPVGGCTNPEACNFDVLATNDDGSCEFESCAGCLQEAACNYDATALYADDSCEFPPFGYDCDGNCLLDEDGDGVCDPFEIAGCQDLAACNYDPAATDPGQCNYANPSFDCDGNSLRPIFTAFPANVTVQGWQVPAVEDAVVEAVVSPFAPGFEATYNGNLCYDEANAPVISFDGETRIDGVCEHDYTLFRSWTATDCSGYTRTREQIIVVVDTVPPVVFVPEDVTILCQDINVADLGEASGTDDCGEVTIELVEEVIPGDCPGSYTIVRTFNAMDPCQNTASGQQIVTVVDNEAPVLEALADVVINCSEALPTTLPTATDNCSTAEVTVLETIIPGDCPQTYTVERAFTAVDECGNESTSLQNVEVVDDSAPFVISGFAGCDDASTCAIHINELEGESIPEANLEIGDDCDDSPTYTATDVVLSSSEALEVVLREYTLTDACGNTLTLFEQFEVTLIYEGCMDEAACNYDDQANVQDDSCDFCSCGENACGCTDDEACNYDSDAVYEDDSCTYPDPGFDCDGVCYDVNDNGICDFEEAGCTDESACNYDPFAQVEDGSCDYCCAHETFTSTEADYGVSIDLVQTHTSGDLAGMSTYRVFVTTPNDDDILTAVTGDDEFPLTLHTTTSFYQNVFGGCLGSNISPAMMVVAPDAAYDSWVTIGATSSDDLSDGEAQLIPGAWIDSFEEGNSITVDDNIGSGWYLIPPGGLNGVSGDDNRVLVAQLTTDGVISGSFRVQIFPNGDQVNDIRPDLTFQQQPLGAFACPIIEEGPADAVASCDDVPGLPGADDFVVSYSNAEASAFGCEGDLEVTLVADETTAGACPGQYTIARTVKVENCAGGSAEYTYVIEVVDDSAPQFVSVPADYTLECSEGLVFDDASAVDNCGEVTIAVTSETIEGNATGNYTVVRTFVATDECGNASEAVQTITVEDTTAPEFTSIPADYTAECSDELMLEDATASDNCNGAVIEVATEIIAGDAAGNYTVVRTFTATDDAGNSTSATQTITVEDTTAPEFTSIPADYTSECSDDLILDDATASDNCGEVTIEVSSETIAGDAAGNYTVVRTFTATDDADNSTSATQTITVQDTTAPEFTSIPADYTAECTDELIYDDASAIDNCGEVSISVLTETIAGDCVGTSTIIRTFTATDDAGNSSSATQTISVVDTTAPELVIPEDYTAECDEDLTFDDASATDNCAVCDENFDFTSTVDGYGLSLELVASHEGGALDGMRTYRVYLDVANSDDQVTSLTGNDEFALAFNTTTSFYQNAFGGPTPNDISAGAIGLVPELEFDSYVTIGLTGQPEGQEGTVEMIPGTWMDTFEAGQSFTINDGIGSGWYIVPPTAVNGLGGDDQRVLVAQLTTDGDISGQFRTQVFPQGDQENDVRADLTFSHTHSCTDVTIEVSSETIAGDCVGNYTIERTFTATDDCGNSTSAIQTITVEDTTAPEFTSIPADYTSECSDDLILDDATASDNCGEVTIEVSSETIAGDCAGNYTVVRTFTATDDCGNSTSATQTITVEDTTAPEFTSIPADYTSECSDDLILDDATASDNCGEVTIEVSSETIAGDAAGNYTVVRTFTATDDCGNSTSATQTITVEDTTAPEFTSIPADYTSECSDDLILDDATASDNCGEVTIEVSSETIAGDAAGNYTVVRTFTATDDAGNSTSATQTITVEDTTAPEFTSIPADYTSECSDDLILDDATASDNCGEVTIEVSSETIAGDAAGNYTVVRTFTATDDAGNSTSATQTITVEDTTAPEFTSIPADYTSECSDDLILDDATASDNCGEVTIEVSSETIAGDAAGNYTVVRTFTATDDAGNSTSATQTITVEDTTAPEFTSIPADYTSECSDDLILDDATASDNCGEVTIEVSSETIAGDAAGNYTVVRTFTATDDAGNSTSATQTITVEDTTAPEFTSIPADYTSECSDDLILDDATASDNCGEVTIEVSSETIAGDAAGNYTVVRTFTATDDAGNSTSATQTITVEDTTAPEFTSIPADYTSECSDDLILDDATASDNCGEVTIEVSSETIAGDAAGNYTVVRTFTATDDAGNSTSATQTITVEDTTAPEFTSIPADYTSECSDDLILDDATASDNCGEVTIEVSSETIAGDAAGNYTVVRTFTATDDAGNSTSATQTITVEDTTAPEFTSIPADYTSECSDDLILDDATASDNCGEVTIEVSSETIAGDAAGNYTVVRTFTATDDAGNSTSATQTITVEDTTAPEFTSIPADYTSECSDDLILDDATASDNCGEVTIEVSSETIAGDAAGNYTVVRTFTATDDAGNSTSATQTITVEDTTAPEFTSIPADYTSECSDDLILDDATASDNCGEVTIEVSSETIAGDAAGNYTVVRTFTATDDAGNSTSATQTITVEDTTAPEFTSIPADYTSECSDDLILDDATASDNCGEVTIEVSSETIAGDAAGNYTVVRTFTATDDAGNSTSATQTITVEDTTAPEFTSIPADYTSECSDDLILDDATASDNCGEVTIEVSSETIAGDAAGNYTVVRTFTATDDAGNSTSATQTITVEDTTAPEFTSIPADYTSECSDDLILDDATASDNCGEVTIEVSSETIAGDAAGNYTVVRTFTATDDAGNSTSATQTITVEDTTAPEFTSIPADYTSECSDELIYDDASAIDNCGEVSISVLTETIAGDCVGTSTIIRTFTATDDAGNSSSATQTISVVDTTAPELVIPEDYTAECDEDLTFDDASATDNCAVCDENFDFTSTVDGYGLSLELVASHEGGALDGMRTYRVYLDVANSDDQVTSLTGNDEFALAFNTTTSFYQNAFGGPTPNDISAGAIGLVPELEFDSYVTIGLTGQPEGQEGTVEMIPGTWMDTFEAGQSFTINDGIGSGWYIVPPTAVNGLGGDDQRVLVAQLTTDGDISGQFRTQVFPQGDQENDVRADLTFSHTHSCTDVTIEVSSETIAGDCVGNYTIERTFTATDDCGNSTSAIQTITVEDTTAPEFTSIPADYTSECSDDLILDDATASDNCGEVTIEVSSETIAGDCAGNYTVVRTFTATDDCGNSTSATQTITVEDTTAPEFTSIPADYTSECSDDLILDDATASDNCGEVTIEVSSETIAGDCVGNYTVVRTFTATDDCGNSTSATQTITVQDTTAPEWITSSSTSGFTGDFAPELWVATEGVSIGESTLIIEGYDTGDETGNTDYAWGDGLNQQATAQCISAGATVSFDWSYSTVDGPNWDPGFYINGALVASLTDDNGATSQNGSVSFDCVGGDAIGFAVNSVDGIWGPGILTITNFTITSNGGMLPEDITVECDEVPVAAELSASDNCSDVSVDYLETREDGSCPDSYTLTRVWTATDDCGNATIHTQTIAVEDTTAPEFTSIPADYTSECSDDLILDDATASDNCGEVTIEVSSETIAGDCAGNYTVVRTFTATDDCGNSTSATQTITVEDTTAPEFTSIPADYTSECSDDLILDDATASDNCGEVTIEVSSETIAGDAAGNYTVVRTFTATDDCGNSTSATQTITVEDTTAPEFTSIPADYTSECSDDLILDDATASDNCGEVTIEVSSETIAGDAAGNYTVVRTFTATDDAGNSTSATQTITVEDTTAPEFTSIPADYTSECSDDLILDDATASDNCGEVTIEVSSETIAGDAAGNYTVVRTFTATDDAGNSTSATQTITVEDTTAPEFTSIPADYTSECSDDLILDDATASDNCGEVTIEVSSETIAGDAAGNYTVVRTFTATDDAGNSTSATQTITVEDTTAPEFTSIPADYTSECSDDLILDDATASDNCGEVTIEVSSETIAGDAAGNYTVVRTFTATDDAGNSTSATQTITVEDTTAPEFTSIPADYTSECSDDLILDDATASDNCGEVTIEVSSETIAGDAAGNYTVVRTFTATDDAGNSTSATQTITVEDTTAPEFTSIPADYTSECNVDLGLIDGAYGAGEETIHLTLTLDDYGSETTWSIDGPNGNVANGGPYSDSYDVAGDNETFVYEFDVPTGCYTLTVNDAWGDGLQYNGVVGNYTLTDDSGNVLAQMVEGGNFGSQAIHEFCVDPGLALPSDLLATDNCGAISYSVVSDTTAGDCAGNYTIVRTFTATDDAGNSASATQTITVEDTTAPEFTSIPADYTSECSDDLILDDATASDNCGEVTVTVDTETIAGDAAGNYTVVRTFTATDDCGNSTSATQTITVEDTTAPEFTSIPADYTSECSDDLILDDATASDNCGEVTIEVSSETTAGDCVGNYTVVRTFTATDDAGNSTSATQTITVQDTTAPEFTSIPADYTSECSDDLILDDATASDNCGEVTIEVSSETIAGDCAGNYTIVRTFTATDDCGNSTSATQTITVEDTTAPEFTSIPADYTSECSDDLILDDATASDNCGEVTIEVSSETIAGDCVGNYTIERTFTATDDCGNSTSATQRITVQDTTAPEFTSIPADYTSECSDDLILDDATASDNCGEVTIEVSSETIAGDCVGNYTVVRTFTATDDCGNSTSATQTITVEDTTAPEFTSIPADYTSECSDDLILDDATASDNCGEVTIEVSSETIAGDCAGNYTVVRTFTATDDCGNSTSATQTITVEDTTAPEFTSIPADYTSECSDDLILDDATASDNCGEVTIEVSSETIAGDCVGNYTIERTFTATDDCGNSTSATQTITVEDTTAPEFTSIPADYTSECSDDLILDDATASDNCGEVTIDISSETIAGDCAGNYTVVRTFTATDDCGNSTSATQTITVEDTTAPEFTSIPADYTSECSDDLILDDATASDNCGEVTIEVSSETIAGDCVGNYTVVRTFTATDDCGNSTSATQTITVQDTTAPEWITSSSTSGFTGDFAPELWVSTEGVSISGSTLSIQGYDELNAAWSDGFGQQATAQCVSSGATVSFDWSYNTTDSDGPSYDPGFYINGSLVASLTDDNGSTSQSGSFSFDCIGGDAIGFAVNSTDGAYGEAFLTITNFTITSNGGMLPEDITVECDEVPVATELSASDNCSDVSVDYLETREDGSCPDSYTLTRVWTATDDCGNATIHTQTIAVEDTTAPEFTSIPADYTAECTDELIYDDASAIDNCGEVSISVLTETIAGDCIGTSTIIRTFTATDDCGNSSSATQTISVVDTTAPELVIPEDYTAECDEDLTFDDASATDNCAVCDENFDFTSTVDGYGLSLELVASHEGGALDGMRTYRVYLDVANSDDQVTSLTGNDEFALAFNTTTSFYQNAFGGPTPNDISAGAIGLVPELEFDSYVTIGLTGQPEGQEGTVEMIPGTWMDTFEAGQSFTINDGIGSGWYIVPPTAVNGLGGDDQRVLVAQLTTDGDISGQFRTQVFPQGDQENDVRADLTFSHTHSCTDVTIEVSSETIAGDCVGNYTIERTFTATDDCGNSTSAIQTITVEDTTAPEFTSIPADYTSECSDDLILDDATASDNCGEVTIEVSSETIAGDCAGNYTVVRTFTATDDCGNSTSATQTITVEDTTAPEFTSIPADYTSECSDDLILDDATASDNCGEVTIEVSSETIAGDAAGNYTVVRTFTATDDCGNSTSATQTITVEDTTAPEFTSIPADYTSECSDDLILDDATASDNCGEVTIEVSSETIAGDAAGNYTVVRTFTATDDAGNSTSATQTITVEDTTAPEFTSIPADYTSECSDDLILDDATASDNCGEVTIEVSSETIAGDAAGNYTVVRTFTATDDAGNSTSATQTITVEDTTAPEFTSIPADYTSECSDDLILDDATASDNCGEVTIEVSSETIAGDAAGNYTVVRTFTATDDAGNSTSATQTITVEDTTAPEFTSIPADYTSECSDDLILDDATASDNCGEVTIEVSSETIAGDAAGNYTVVRTFTATDDAGNSTSATQTITVEDTTAPEFTSIPADYTSECSDDLILDDATASDNCGEVTIEVSSETIAGDAAGNYTVVRTFTATDDAGNSTSATQTITVEDTTSPEFTSIPADYTSECSDDLILDDATASDNCGEVTIEVSSETIAGDAAGNYTVVRTFTATDDAGNSTSATQTITVEDTTLLSSRASQQTTRLSALTI